MSAVMETSDEARMSQHQSEDCLNSYQHPVKMSWSTDFFLSLILKPVWQANFLHLVCCLITGEEGE